MIVLRILEQLTRPSMSLVVVRENKIALIPQFGCKIFIVTFVLPKSMADEYYSPVDKKWKDKK